MTDLRLAARIADAMIPGQKGRWPAASSVIDPLDLGEAMTDVLAQVAATDAPLSASPAELLGRVAPAAVERLRDALYASYYTAPAVQALIRAIAEAAPRDPSPFFDEALLAAVKRRGAPVREADMEDDRRDIVLSSPPGMYRGATYEHAARFGDFIFVAGQVAKDIDGQVVGPGDIEVQAHAVFVNLGRVLAQAGSEPADIVKLTTYLIDSEHAGPSAKARRAFLGSHRPPHTGLVVKSLGSPGVVIEVEAIAVARRAG